jgi:lipoyl(octanoyl) transferase
MDRGDRTGPALRAAWLGRAPYRDAWALQKRLAAARADGIVPDTLLLLEHDAVLTLGRQADEAHVLAPRRELRRRGIELLRVERGGEVTYHGPGQLVAYPILRLGDRGLLVRPLVRALEEAMIATCAALGVEAFRRDGHPGCWVDDGPGRPPHKIGALGIRIERGVSYHGIALNIDPDLRDFELIDPCGTPGLISTSIADALGRSAEPPTTAAVEVAAWLFAAAFGRAIGAAIERVDPADLDAEASGGDGAPASGAGQSSMATVAG